MAFNALEDVARFDIEQASEALERNLEATRLAQDPKAGAKAGAKWSCDRQPEIWKTVWSKVLERSGAWIHIGHRHRFMILGPKVLSTSKSTSKYPFVFFHKLDIDGHRFPKCLSFEWHSSNTAQVMKREACHQVVQRTVARRGR